LQWITGQQRSTVCKTKLMADYYNAWRSPDFSLLSCSFITTLLKKLAGNFKFCTELWRAKYRWQREWLTLHQHPEIMLNVCGLNSLSSSEYSRIYYVETSNWHYSGTLYIYIYIYIYIYLENTWCRRFGDPYSLILTEKWPKHIIVFIYHYHWHEKNFKTIAVLLILYWSYVHFTK
jgi:hypothetical protein